MRVYNHGFAGFTKFFAIVIFSGGLNGHPAKHSGASSRGREGSFSHTSIFESGRWFVNRQAIWLYRIRNCFCGACLVPVLAAVYHYLVAAGVSRRSPKLSLCRNIRIT